MRVKRIALTGGIATGKSTVARRFTELGAALLDADVVARNVVQPGSACWRELREFLGPDYFEPDGTLRRRPLRDRIVQDHHCRFRVNAILHPAILEAMEAQWHRHQQTHPSQVFIFDIPLLFEADMAHRFDTVILVFAPRQVQIQRLMERDGLSAAEAEATLTMQLPIESKRNGSHIVIDNGGDPEDTRRQVDAVWKQLSSRLDD